GHHHQESFYVTTIQGREDLNVKFVRIDIMKYSSQYRFHIVPIDHFQSCITISGLTVARCLTALPFYRDVVLDNV
ncbi:19235_t:CDS:2, partial [Gigaspora margarita]